MQNYQIITVGKNQQVFFNKDQNYRSPVYRIIGPKVSQYLRTFDGEKFGFMTIHRNVCPPRFSRLPNIADLFFYGFAIMQVGEGWGLVNHNGYDLLEPKFDELYIYNEDVVIVGKDGFYGLFFPNENILTDIKYTDFELKEDYILTFANELQGVLLYDNTEIFEPQYVKVEKFYDMFKATKQNGKQVLNSFKWRKPSTDADEFFPPKNGGLRARNGKVYALISEDTGNNITPFKYRAVEDYNEFGFALAKDGMLSVIKFVDKSGKEFDKFMRN